ncbi:MAG: hypothetical protein OXI01_01045 [Albidovulum sp.]|nr:hypothetical protein [Albidovulum sp.]
MNVPARIAREGEARLVAPGCSKPPEGFASWTLSLLADKLVELKAVESTGPETVRKSLKKSSAALESRL